MSTQLFQSLFNPNTNFGTYILKTKQVMTSSLSLFFSEKARQVSNSREMGHILKSFLCEQNHELCSKDKCLIIMLSNCSHTLHVVVPRIIDNLTKHGYVEMEKASKVCECVSVFQCVGVSVCRLICMHMCVC